MIAWWESLQAIQQVFYIIAIPATLILILQTILLLFGMGHDSETDIDHDVDHDIGDHDAAGDGANHEAGLRILTVRGIVAFLAVCGWVGVALTDLGVSMPLTIFIAILCGLAAMLLVAVLLRAATKSSRAAIWTYATPSG